MNVILARRLLELHEGRRLRPYDDRTGERVDVLPSGGQLTIGVGRNLSARGITGPEADLLFHHDLDTHARDLLTAWPWMASLDTVRLLVLVDMAFNLGVVRLKAFAPTIDTIHRGAYATAAQRMVKTKWAHQVGRRAIRLAEMMRSGELPPELRD